MVDWKNESVHEHGTDDLFVTDQEFDNMAGESNSLWAATPSWSTKKNLTS